MAGQIQSARLDVLRENLSVPCAAPERLFAHLSPQETLYLLAELLDSTSVPSQGMRHFGLLLGATIGVGILLTSLFLFGSIDFPGRAYLALAVLFIVVIRILRRSDTDKSTLVRLHTNTAQVLSHTFGQLVRSSELPLALEAARRIGPLETAEATQAWSKALYALLTRLLPRLTEEQASALTIDQRAFLRGVLYLFLPVEVVVAILLTLASAGDRTGLEVAKRFATHPDERVREALSEYHAALRKRG